ncbi:MULTISPECIES: RNA polymerase sigma factor [unclassified Bacillus (in: firmicutes)]|uniref:RNA polymerase sigma factor n=1 Tax=unclassified Bacillus (in: firmicutes) TaxID=185979 RepID=UPI0008E4175E|nr:MULTISPECIES: RNA polymerase sigma factor [unclassified Bacillus (in: firmicutes)]SFA97514.1 RNA polymerase sigma-70 factor, ECF subfamily [Bacillus sp. UNCCL13]SFQ80517.1 RNA polymerase sigma-70 factor, ECF subfamily [Bacillus sp. cl95]
MISNEISEWFYLYNKDIYHYLVYYIGSSDVEDLVQEVFIRAIKGFDTYQKKSSPKTWLFSIARNVGIDEIRKRKRLRMKQMIWFRDEQTDKETPEKILQLNENNRLLYQAIQSLKANYRDVIILRGIKEFSVSETASILNWNENKVRITYHRALKTLQKVKEDFLHER